MSAAAFIVLAGMGAVLRWLAADRWPGGHRGTLLVNVLGAFLLGLLVGNDATSTAVTVGGLGALTTFSTFAADMFDLHEQSGRTVAAGHMAATLVLGLAAAWLGLEIAS